jgi:hypothetical protein
MDLNVSLSYVYKQPRYLGLYTLSTPAFLPLVYPAYAFLDMSLRILL